MAPGARGYGRNGPRRNQYQEVDTGRGSKVYRTTAEEKGKWIEAARSAANAATSKAEQKKQVSSSAAPKTEIAAPPGLSLPPRHSEALLQSEAAAVDPEDFVKVLGARSLPSALTSDQQLQESFDTAVLSCVESFYRDRITPTVCELQQRLREMEWSSCEVQAVLAWCARKPETYDVSPPGRDKPCLVLLRDPPEWFQGWVHDEESENTYSEDTWVDLRNILKDIMQESPHFNKFAGGVYQLASLVQKRKTGSHMSSLSLGEIRHMLRQGLGPHHCDFTYDASHGGRLTMPSMRGTCEENLTPTPLGHISSDVCDVSHVATPTRSVPKASKGTPAKTSGPNSKQCTPSHASPPVRPETVEERVLDMLKNRPLPDGLGTNKRLRALRSCVDSLYRDRIEPSLSEVQQRLLKKGWTFQEVQGLLPLCARTNEYEIKLPVDGCQVRILLRSPPSWFDGWISDVQKEERNFISADVWDVLAAFLKTECPSLAGSINGAAQDLRQLSLPGPLQQMSLGELREVVRCSIEDHGLLRYWEGGLVPTEITVQPKHVDVATPDKKRIYSCI